MWLLLVSHVSQPGQVKQSRWSEASLRSKHTLGHRNPVAKYRLEISQPKNS